MYRGFGNIDENVLGPDGATISVSLPDGWWEMTVQAQEDWLRTSNLSPEVAALVEDQLSIGAGPGAQAAPQPQKILQTPFGPIKQTDLILYGGIGAALLVVLILADNK